MLWQAADIHEALVLNALVFACILLISAVMRPDRPFDRVLLNFVGLALTANYLAWRLGETAPHPADGIVFVYQLSFLVMEVLTILGGVTSLLIMMAMVDRGPEFERARAAFAARPKRPAVDVFICTYDEPRAILERAMLCAREIDHPQVTVWVCDDTRRPWVRELCAELGLRYVTRPDNTGAKAGNLNNALAHTRALTNAPFVLVLDADFCVRPEILTRMLPLFEDPRVGIVQSPQYFYNPDPIQHNLHARRTVCDDQRSFFDVLQPSKDAVDAAFCVGTSFVVRREAVEALGGFPDDAICEDLNLTYRLARIGLVTRWLDERLSVGISAESIPEYLTQRTRWCLGTIQVGLRPQGPVFGSGYSATLRAHYLQNLLCWTTKPFVLFALVAPAIYLWTDVPVFQTELAPFLAAGLPCFLFAWVHTIWVSGGRCLPIFGEAAQAVIGTAVARTLLVGATDPFGKPFKVTAKGTDRSRAQVHWPLARVFLALLALTGGGLAWSFLSADAPAAPSELDLFNIVWSFFAMLVSLVALLSLVDRPRPAEELFDLGEEATVVDAAGRTHPARLVRASTGVAVLAAPGGTGSGAAGGALSDAPLALRVAGVGAVAARLEGHEGGQALLRLAPTEAQRRALIVKLYGGHGSGVADSGSFGPALLGALESATRLAPREPGAAR